MQEVDPTLAADTPTRVPGRRSLIRRFVFLYYVVLALVLLALIPPLISVNRYQRRIALSISQSLGRPVHLDKVTLSLLPLPGFTIENLVVSEDPAFGSEPVIRANSVRANLRLSSLWRRQVEFSSISFTEPSVNLVHLPSGKWNLESILLRAAHLQAAPTAQRTAGSAPRFPYIEATGARLNLKEGFEKLPISLNEAEFALWEPNSQQWRLRIEAHPSRSDTSVSDTGVLRLEATLGHATVLSQIPINLDAEWRASPLGAASQFLLAHDAGIRGEMSLMAHAEGTVGNSPVTTRVRLAGLRRADFIPERPLNVDLQCQGTATGSFHTFNDLQCSWVPTGSAQPIVLTATVPDVRNLDSATAKIGTPGLPLNTIIDWLHIASQRVPADLVAEGTVTGSIESAPGLVHLWPRWDGMIDGGVHLANATLKSGQAGLGTFVPGSFDFESSAAPSRGRHAQPISPSAGFVLEPTSIDLGGKDPVTLEGRFDSQGLELHLAGMALLPRLAALGKALPQLGEALEDVIPTNRAAGPVRVDLTLNRPWKGTASWQDNTIHAIPTHPAPRARKAKR